MINMNKNCLAAVFLSVIVFFHSVQCGFLNSEQPVAKVNDAKLTMEDLSLMVARIGTEEDYHNAQSRFVNEWVDNELLYQEAIRQNLKPTPFMEAEIERVRRNMLVNIFLDFQIESIISVSNFEIEEYYKNNQQDFVAESIMFRFSAIKTTLAVFAGDLEKELNEGTGIEMLFNNNPDRYQIVSNGKDFIPGVLINPDMETALQKIPINNSYTRHTFSDEIYFIKMEEILLAGESKPMASVAQEIKQRLLHDKRQEKYNNLISRLRTNYPYEINLNAPSETEQSTPPKRRPK